MFVPDTMNRELALVASPFERRVAPLPSKTRSARPTLRPRSMRYVPPALNTIVEPAGTDGSQLCKAADASLPPVASIDVGTGMPVAVDAGVGTGVAVGTGVGTGCVSRA